MVSRIKSRMLVISLVVTLCVHNVAAACPTCKASLGGDPANSSLVQGYFWSIVFMMSMPFLILGGMGAYFYLLVRRARVRRNTPVPASNAALSESSSQPRAVTDREAVSV